MAKVALISGANKGLGLETARQLGQLGYTVLVGARDSARGSEAAEQLKSEGIDARFVHLDLEDSSTFDSVKQYISDTFGSLDALVNNAGVNLEAGAKATDVSIDVVRKVYDINLFAQIELTQKLLPLLEKSDAGRIVNLSSILGSLKLNADPKSPFGDWRSLGYNSSKAALNAFTAILSYELRDTKIKVNSAHPGWVKTDMGGENAPMELEDGAKTSVWLATLPDDGQQLVTSTCRSTSLGKNLADHRVLDWVRKTVGRRTFEPRSPSRCTARKLSDIEDLGSKGQRFLL